jgi:2-phosphoglycerate kinase
VEGVHVVPGSDLIRKWEASGGVAVGCLLTITDPESHKALLYKRGEITKKGEKKKIEAFDRVRAIQEEMIRLAKLSNWLLIEQKLEPDPLEMVTARLFGEEESTVPYVMDQDLDLLQDLDDSDEQKEKEE